ncbi:MAG TPA: glycosyltransferase family 4 protein [Pyrinomonadaceae bacterium]|nr:glycosyltransferase family 4 protein [Pyrinomonadaceae bacterium]
MTRKTILFGPLPPPFGGVSVYVQALAAHLRDSGVRVWAYTGDRRRETNVRFINHRRLETFWALIQEGRNALILDATHFHFEYPNSLLVPIWLLLKPILGFEWCKNVLDGSLPGRYQNFSAWQRFWFRRALQSIDQFVVVSEELKNWLQTDLQVRKTITVIPCLLPPTSVHELDAETEKSLANYLRGAKRVCSIGVFISDYGFADVANAVEALRAETGTDIQLLLLDGAFACDEGYREQVLRGRAWITAIEKVANEKIAALLSRSDVFVRAVRHEGFGISRVEAIWSGTPVVASTVGETRGMLTFDFGNHEQLIDRLRSVLFDSAASDTSEWSAFFRAEAENNLRALRTVLRIDSGN